VHHRRGRRGRNRRDAVPVILCGASTRRDAAAAAAAAAGAKEHLRRHGLQGGNRLLCGLRGARVQGSVVDEKQVG